MPPQYPEITFGQESVRLPIIGERGESLPHLVERSWHCLDGADLRRLAGIGIDLSRAELSGADLYNADLKCARLCGADLSRAHLYRASLNFADLRDAKLVGAQLYRADLFKADLRGANLCGANLECASLSEADLRDACYDDATRWPEGFDISQHRLQRLQALPDPAWSAPTERLGLSVGADVATPDAEATVLVIYDHQRSLLFILPVKMIMIFVIVDDPGTQDYEEDPFLGHPWADRFTETLHERMASLLGVSPEVLGFGSHDSRSAPLLGNSAPRALLTAPARAGEVHVKAPGYIIDDDVLDELAEARLIEKAYQRNLRTAENMRIALGGEHPLADAEARTWRSLLSAKTRQVDDLKSRLVITV